MLCNGTSHPISSNISETERVFRADASLTKGNHKLVKESQQEFNDHLHQDVTTLLSQSTGFLLVQSFVHFVTLLPSSNWIKNFAFFKTVLSKGVSYQFFLDISEAERVSELNANLTKGNHKSLSVTLYWHFLLRQFLIRQGVQQGKIQNVRIPRALLDF